MTVTASPTPKGHPLRRTSRAHVLVNGPAIRQIRELTGLEIIDIAQALHCSRTYVSRLETGSSEACSPRRFDDLVTCLRLPDPRAIMAHPYGRPGEPASTPTAPVPVQRTAAGSTDPAGPGRHRQDGTGRSTR